MEMCDVMRDGTSARRPAEKKKKKMNI